MSSSSQLRQMVSQRYGRVFFEMACEGDVVGVTLKDVTKLGAMLQSEERDWRLLTNPTISREDQAQVIASLSKTLGLKDLTIRFLNVLSQNGRLSFLSDVLKVFHVAYRESQGKLEGTLEAAHPLSKKAKDALEKKLSQELGKEVALQEVINPELLGGAILKVGTMMVDASFGSRLAKLKTVMMKG